VAINCFNLSAMGPEYGTTIMSHPGPFKTNADWRLYGTYTATVIYCRVGVVVYGQMIGASIYDI
jgi:hypothetical protein